MLDSLFLFSSNDIIPRQCDVKSDMTNLIENIKYQFIQIAGEVDQ